MTLTTSSAEAISVEQILQVLDFELTQYEHVIKTGRQSFIQKDFIKKTVKEKLNSFIQSYQKSIENLSEIGNALSSENDLSSLLQLVLKQTLLFSHADGVKFLKYDKEKKILHHSLVFYRSLQILEDDGKDNIVFKPISTTQFENPLSNKSIEGYVAETGNMIHANDVYELADYDLSSVKEFDRKYNYQTKTMLVIPVKDHEENVLGVLQLINAKSENEVIPFTNETVFFINSLASQLSVVLTNKMLLQETTTLLKQFLKSIALGIDHKSKFTTGHIERVVTFSMMIAKLVNKSENGKFKHIKFNRDELDEIQYAAWMHDLGKISVPSHIMNKSKKLEYIMDNIEIIEYRFKLVQQAIKYDILESKLENNVEKITTLNELKEQLKFDLKFLQLLNLGAEWVSDKDLVYLKKLYDFRYETEEETFFLISEKEYENLSIRKGTLSSGEFDIMKSHVVLTEKMLNEMTFPKHLKNIPIYAGAHHEKLNGKGYPKGLKSYNIPLPARIICIADIFEALTDSHRPYKAAHTMKESLKIMADSARKGEIDSDIMDLILDTGIYNIYKEKFLKHREEDAINILEIKQLYHDIS